MSKVIVYEIPEKGIWNLMGAVDFYLYPITIYDLNCAINEFGETFVLEGSFYNILLYGNINIMGNIVNENIGFTATLFVSNKVNFCDPIKLTKNTINDHVIGNFNIICFEENIEAITNDNQIPSYVKNELLNKITK
jgi:hypothetical protein